MSQFIPSIKPCDTRICQQPRKVHEVVFFFLFTVFPWVLEDTNHAWKVLELISLMMIIWKKGRRKCLFSTGATLECVLHWCLLQQWLFMFKTLSACLIITIFMALTIMNFYEEKPFYRYRRTKGNPLTPILQVLIAAIRKRDLSYPSNPALLCEKGPKEGF